MTEKTIQAGSLVDSKCLKCKEVTTHTVIAMVDGSVAKVECKHCGARHAFRPVKPKSGQKKTKTMKKIGTPRKTTVKKEWEEKVAGSGSKPLPYSMAGSFQEGELIDHSHFGIGYVQKLQRPDKMEVLFEDSLKVLRCDCRR
ncbi:MAG: hypothetical protein ACOC0U_00805 [Desulfovibrionales bacterium]